SLKNCLDALRRPSDGLSNKIHVFANHWRSDDRTGRGHDTWHARPRDSNFAIVSQTDLQGHLIMRRIVVTGLGLVSPLGCGSELAWSRLLSARSGIAALPDWAAVLPARVAGIVPTKADDADGGFDPDKVVPPKDQRRMDRFILFALAAASEAIAQAAWIPSDPHSM